MVKEISLEKDYDPRFKLNSKEDEYLWRKKCRKVLKESDIELAMDYAEVIALSQFDRLPVFMKRINGYIDKIKTSKRTT